MLQCWDAIPAASIESIIVDQFNVSTVEKTRPRKRSSTCLRSLDQFRTELMATLPREIAMKSNAMRQLRIWLKTI